jgi:hypothetical protein
MPEQQLNRTIPEMPRFIPETRNMNRDYPFYDCKVEEITTAVSSYAVGHNQVNAHGDQRKKFVSKSTLVYCTEDAYLIFNNSKNVANYILANTWYEFKSNVYEVFYCTVQAQSAVIKLYFEGTMPAEARSPE